MMPKIQIARPIFELITEWIKIVEQYGRESPQANEYLTRCVEDKDFIFIVYVLDGVAQGKIKFNWNSRP